MSILPHVRTFERDQAPAAAVAFGISDSRVEQGVDEAPLTALISVSRERRYVAGARHWLVDVLIRWGLNDDQIYDAELLLSELLTNSIEHAAGAGPATIGAALWQGHLRITVSDPDPAIHPMPVDDEHGRGLELVRALSLRHGTDRGSAGKVVWAELSAAYACPDCKHLPGCGCDCCPYPMPAVVAAEQLVGGVR